jgi:hypothetical protein
MWETSKNMLQSFFLKKMHVNRCSLLQKLGLFKIHKYAYGSFSSSGHAHEIGLSLLYEFLQKNKFTSSMDTLRCALYSLFVTSNHTFSFFTLPQRMRFVPNIFSFVVHISWLVYENCSDTHIFYYQYHNRCPISYGNDRYLSPIFRGSVRLYLCISV